MRHLNTFIQKTHQWTQVRIPYYHYTGDYLPWLLVNSTLTFSGVDWDGSGENFAHDILLERTGFPPVTIDGSSASDAKTCSTETMTCEITE